MTLHHLVFPSVLNMQTPNWFLSNILDNPLATRGKHFGSNVALFYSTWAQYITQGAHSFIFLSNIKMNRVIWGTQTGEPRIKLPTIWFLDDLLSTSWAAATPLFSWLLLQLAQASVIVMSPSNPITPVLTQSGPASTCDMLPMFWDIGMFLLPFQSELSSSGVSWLTTSDANLVTVF